MNDQENFAEQITSANSAVLGVAFNIMVEHGHGYFIKDFLQCNQCN